MSGVPAARRLLRTAAQGRLTKEQARELSGPLFELSALANDLGDIVSSYADGAYTRGDVSAEVDRLMDTLRTDWAWDLD